jgi:hypothetical protein
MSNSTKRAVNGLVTTIPELQPILREHTDDNGGELLPHVFLGEATRWAVAQYELDPLSIGKFLTALDNEYAGGDASVRELIVVSFLENLPLDSGIRMKLGRHLATAERADD